MDNIIKLPPRSFSGFEIYHTVDNPEFKVKETKDSADKFVVLNGTVDEIAYYDDMLKNSFDEDYEGMSNTGSVSFTTEDISKKRFYKGKKVCLKKTNETGNEITWDDLKSCLLGFISEQTFTLDEVELKLVGMSKLLDQEKEFTFNNTLRSEILKQIIEAAGLKADIDVTGLEDDSIDYTNVSSSSESSNNGYSSSSKDIKKLVAGWIGNETDELRKAELIHNGLRDDVQICWVEYNDSRYETPESCLENHEHLNCGDTSILTVECMREGKLEAYTALRCDSAHYFTVIEIGGKKYYSDLTGPTGVPSTRAFNEVWENNYCGNRHDLP